MIEQEPPSRVELFGDCLEKEQEYLEMAEAYPIVNLEQLIGDECTKISTLNNREMDINKNSTYDIDLVEKDVLLWRIRVERRELQKQWADYSRRV